MSCWKKINNNNNNTSTTVAKATDLMSIMDEELAHKIQAEEEEQQQQYSELYNTEEEQKATEQQPQEKEKEEKEEELTDEELARRLQAEEDDYALAMRLQAELGGKEYAEVAALHEAGMRHYTPPVRISATEASNNSYYDSYNEEEEDDDDDEFYEEDYADLGGNEGDADSVVYMSTSSRPVVLSKAQAARVPAFATKHDPVVNGRKNAEDAAAFVDANFGGDGILPNRAYNALREHSKRAAATRVRVKEAKSDPARSDVVLDTEARLTLQSLLNMGVVRDLSGTLSSGKEANVYHAYAGDDAGLVRQTLSACSGGHRMAASLSPEYALKVFKTVKEFRNRAVYLGEDVLHQTGGGLHSHRVIKVWAQKELGNLLRLKRAGVPCPTPLGLFGSAVLVMQFLGRDGRPAPMLRDVGHLPPHKRSPQSSSSSSITTTTTSGWSKVYAETVRIMRGMYMRARLVHADLSEYNLLYHEGHVWVIDVAQSVPYNHRNATVFLRRDCQTITAFFRKKCPADIPGVLTLRELFDYVTDPAIRPEAEGPRLNSLLQRAAARGTALPEDLRSEEALFMDANIPNSLSAVVSPEALDDLAATAETGSDPVCSSHLTLHGLHQEQLDPADDAAAAICDDDDYNDVDVNGYIYKPLT